MRQDKAKLLVPIFQGTPRHPAMDEASRLAEAQPGIKIAERNINNLRYADDTTLVLWQKAKT